MTDRRRSYGAGNPDYRMRGHVQSMGSPVFELAGRPSLAKVLLQADRITLI